MTIACLCLGQQAYRAEEQRQAILYLRRLGNYKVTYADAPYARFVPSSLRKRMGRDYRQQVVAILLDSGLTSQTLPEVGRQLSRLPYLSELQLKNLCIVEDDLQHLSLLRQITKLELWYSWPWAKPRPEHWGAGMRYLVGWHSLKQISLHLEHRQFGGIQYWPQFSGLEVVALYDATESDIAHLSKCPRLKKLELNRCSCSGATLAAIAAIPTMREIGMWNMLVTWHDPSFDAPEWQLSPSGLEQLNFLEVNRLETWLQEKRPELEFRAGQAS